MKRQRNPAKPDPKGRALCSLLLLTALKNGATDLTKPEDVKPVISYINTSFLGTSNGIKVAYADYVDSDGNIHFEAMTDPAHFTAGDQRTSVMADVYETKGIGRKASVAVGFNADKLALDFLRDEGN